ncbi:MAG: glycosyltransferase family 4 protein [Vicinamibacterales bacterium]
MIDTTVIFIFLAAAIVAATLTPGVRALALRVGAVDAPGARKIHALATPRLGGVAVLAAGVSALALAAGVSRVLGTPAESLLTPTARALGVGAAIVFAVGLRDDVKGVTPSAKLAAISLAAALALADGILIQRFTLFHHTYQLGLLAMPATFLWIVGLTNAFNLIDGLDGLATGMAIIAATSCGLLLLIRGDRQNAVVLVALVGAGVGFLPYNFNPATIFLGDCGSLVFGFVLAVTAITGWQKGATALAVGAPLLVLALPIADVVGSVARRVAGRRPVFAPDQRHIHHWLLRLGLSHRGAVLVLYACALVLAALAVLTADLR